MGCGVNELPLSMVLSWYEQKAIAVVLTLLWLGVKNLRMGRRCRRFCRRECWRCWRRTTT